MSSLSNILSEIPVFVYVAETKSFTLAAKRAGISASAVSKAISRLEDSLGIQLFHRTTRSVRLTDDGSAYYVHCKQLLSGLQEAQNILTQSKSKPRGRLRVSLPVALGGLLIIPVLPRWLSRYPDLSVEVDLSDRFVDLVGEGFDVAIRIGETQDLRLIERRLPAGQSILCASPDYLERYGNPKSPHELSQHNFYLSSRHESTPFELPLEKDGELLKVSVAGNVTLSSAEALVEIAKAGYGITGVLNFIASRSLREGSLKVVLSDWSIPISPPISIVYPQNRHLSAKVRVFVSFIAELFSRGYHTAGLEDMAG